MGFLEWHYIVALVIGFACWLYSKIKTFQKQLNRRNNRVPDITILRKIVPVSCNNGWKVKSVCNAFPVWYYSTTFTFAPRSLVATRTILQGTSARILEELKDIKVFSMIFPDFPSFQRKVEKQATDKDTLIISNAFSSLSLSNILLTGQQSVLTFERYWSSGVEGSWLYVLPTVQLLSSKYGYWFCFLLQDLDNNTSLLHIISSYPDSVSFQTINKGISSCQVLIKDHIETMLREKAMQPPNSLILPSASTNETPKVKKRRSRASSNTLVTSDLSSPATPLSLNSSVEAIGRVEEPAVIQHTVQLEDVPRTLADNVKGKRKSESPTSSDKINVSRQSLNTSGSSGKAATPTVEVKSKTKAKPRKVKQAARNIPSVTDIVKQYPRLAPYTEPIYESLKILHNIWEATESTEGWAFYHEKDGVVVHRKAATGEEGSFPADVCKGKTSMQVPLSYLMMYIKNLENRPEYDGMYESGSIIEELGDSVSSIVHLVFKNLFLVTGRDFCSLSAWRHIKGNLYGLMNKGVVHLDCPETKSKVRGNIIVGGYVFEEVSSSPPIVDVMYAVCTNMNGAIPQKIVNKVLVDQPMSLASVREKVEARYRGNPETGDPKFHTSSEFLEAIKALPSVYPADIGDADGDSNEEEGENEVFDSQVPVNDVNDVEVDVQLETGPFAMIGEPQVVAEDVSNVESGPPSSFPVDVPDKADGFGTENGRLSTQEQMGFSNSPTINPLYTSDTVLSSGFDLKENHYSQSMDSLDLPRIAAEDDYQSDNENADTESVGSQYSEDGSSNSFHSLEHPRDSQGHIDFAALADQSVGGLEEEFFAAQKVDTSIKHHESVEIHDQWMYRGTTKNVVIMRKTSAKQKIHCFLGRGIIKVLPVTVWEMIRQPTTRHVYDSMLKKIATIKQIDKRSKVLHMRHETQACFVKQARDFCVMTVETVKHQRYTLTGVSVDIPECQPTSDCVRGRVFSSGWIIEPIMQNGKAASMVTYISQVDFGGRLPSRLVNFIAKRQPLAVAYLRTYLEDAAR